MSAGGEDGQTWDARPRRAEVLTGRDRPTSRTEDREPESPPEADEPRDTIFVDAHEDRWHWRRRIRRNPRQLFLYRIGVGVVGLVFVMLGFATGWIPGPGGIPLVLLGLAIWSSEFEWAHRLMLWFKDQLRRYQRWSRRQKIAFWVFFFSVCGLCGYLYMLALGVPGWLPNPAEGLLARLPGLP